MFNATTNDESRFLNPSFSRRTFLRASAVAALTSYLASTFLAPGQKREDTELMQIKAELAEIRTLLGERASVNSGQ